VITEDQENAEADLVTSMGKEEAKEGIRTRK
jgi:hypothetical protein